MPTKSLADTTANWAHNTAEKCGGIIEAGDDGEGLEAAGDSDDIDVDEQGRPDDCECMGDALEVDHGLPCWPCYRDGFETPDPAAQEDE